MMTTWRALLGGILTAAVLSACGGGGSGPSPSPLISNLSWRTARIGLVAGFRVEVDFQDVNGDVLGGTCRLATNRGELYIPIEATPANVNATAGRVACWVIGRGGLTYLTGTITLIDRAGHESNALRFEFFVERRSGE